MKFATALKGCLIALGLLGTLTTQAEAPGDRVRGGVYQNLPQVFIDEKAISQGFWVDLFNHIATAEAWSVEYLPCQWEICLQAVEHGQLDLMMDVAYSEERDRRFDFNQDVVFISSAYYQAIEHWLELQEQFGWKQIRHLLTNLAIYSPILGLGVVILWNRLLRREIHRRKQSERALRETESRLQTMADNMPGVLFGYRLRPDGSDQFTYISSGFNDLYGFAPDGALQDTRVVWDMTHPDDIEHLQRSVATSYQSLSTWRCQYRVITPTGQLKWLQGISRPTQQPNGDVVWDGLIIDISDRKQAEEALQESERRFRNIATNIPGAILQYVLHSDGTDSILYISRGCYDLWEIDADVARNNPQRLWDMVHPDDRPAMYQAVQVSAKTLQPWYWHWRIIAPSGQVKWLEAAGRPERSANGDVVWDTVIINVSDRKRTEAALQASEVRYRKVVEAQTDFILRSLPDTTITFANSALCQALGVSLQEIVGHKWVDFANPDDLQGQTFNEIAKLSPQHPRCFVENRDTRADGQEGWTQWLNEGVFDEAGQLVEIQSVGRDITPLKQVEHALRESEERLRLVTETMSDLVCLHEPNGRYLYVTPSSLPLLGYRPNELIGRDPYELFHPDDRDRIRKESHKLALKKAPVPATYRIRKKDGTYIWLETLTHTITDASGQVIHLQTTSRDVSDRVRAEQQLKHDALHDGLTGLPNRTLLMERLDLALKRSNRHSRYQFAVLFLDLDNFKVVNDSLGHLVGDELLLIVAKLLTTFIRETDFAARLGGDEFVILLEDLDEVGQAVQVANRILEALRSPFTISERDVVISTSIGIVPRSPSHERPADLLRDADLAMYRAKHSGRAGYALFDPNMHLQVLQRLHLEQDLRKALERQEFLLYYQPIVSLDNQRIHGFEALLRWQHPTQGLVPPGQFIAIAEETGLIVPIGRWVLSTACQQLICWQRQFPHLPLRISVNLSVQQLQGFLLKHLDDALTDSGLPSDSLILEITESMLIQNIGPTLELLNQIKARGVRLSIDDFGTGYSSLSYLHQLPVDALKIDRAFVSPSEPDARNQVIAESIIALSNLLELNAIAEGVEHIQQLQWLQTLGCELGQGNLFSVPVPPTAATAMLRQPVPSLP